MLSRTGVRIGRTTEHTTGIRSCPSSPAVLACGACGECVAPGTRAHGLTSALAYVCPRLRVPSLLGTENLGRDREPSAQGQRRILHVHTNPAKLALQQLRAAIFCVERGLELWVCTGLCVLLLARLCLQQGVRACMLPVRACILPVRACMLPERWSRVSRVACIMRHAFM